ncbi:hypothetical protein JCM3770_006371 [Rhodotorula araucariae]
MDSPDPLASALATHARLRAHLDDARAALDQRTRQRRLRHDRTLAPAHERTLRTRLTSANAQLAHARAAHSLDTAVTRSLDLALVVLDPPLAPLLTQRDDLALSLLHLTKHLASLASERARLRRSLLRLNRANAALVASLRTRDAPSTPSARAEAIRALPAPVAAYHSRLHNVELPALRARLAVLQGVLTRLVADAGLVLPPPLSPLPPGDPLAQLDEALAASEGAGDGNGAGDGEPWGPDRVWHVLLLAGADAGLADDEGAGAGCEAGQTLPAELRREVDAARDREGAGAGPRRGATPRRAAAGEKKAKGRSRTVG